MITAKLITIDSIANIAAPNVLKIIIVKIFHHQVFVVIVIILAEIILKNGVDMVKLVKKILVMEHQI